MVKIDLVLLAGGHGGSLRPITEYMPKAMLPLGNKILIHRILETVTSTCKINKIILISNYFCELIFEYVCILSQAGIINNELFFFNASSFKPTNGGILQRIKDKLSNNFILYYADVLPLYMDFNSLINQHLKKKDSSYLGTLSTSYYYKLETGYIETDGENITTFTEKPDKDGKLKNMAIGIFKKDLLDTISNDGDDFYKDVIPNTIKQGYKFGNYIHEHGWHHFQHINKYHLEQVIKYKEWIK